MRIYLDNAATTPCDERVVAAMLPYFTQAFGNASSVYTAGREARAAVEKARRQVAAALSCRADEIYFTSGGSESDNWALKGAAFAQTAKKRLITSCIEHHAILHTCDFLARQGFEVTYLPVDENGLVSPEKVENAMGDDVFLLSVMAANNETGTIEPVKALSDIAHRHGALFHTDAVQAMGALPLSAQEIGADMLSLSAHKLHGPKGVGALYIKNGTHLSPLIHGGAQEKGMRAGTENLPGIVGLGEAFTLAVQERETHNLHVAALRDRLTALLLASCPGARVNCASAPRLPGTVNIVFPHVDGKALLARLDLAGVYVSAGSACTAGSVEPSHVLTAIGLPDNDVQSSLRFSFSWQNTMEEADAAAEIIIQQVQALQK